MEQAISVIFEPIDGFRIVDYGLFWLEIAADFPDVTTDAPLEAPVENFDGIRQGELSLQLMKAPPIPRVLFRNAANGELIQVQNTRFGFNWAKVGGSPYPRSEPLMARFKELFGRFAAYVERQGLGPIILKQCELTNLNVIPVADFGDSFADLPKALKVDPLDLGLPNLQAEAFERSRQHKILGDDGAPVGRLHMVVTPVVSNVDQSEAFRYELTVRSAPNIRNLSDASEFFEVARNAINGAFSASITDAMRVKWGEKNGA
jgi:uncharacterized protein (TIGR04255 family)